MIITGLWQHKNDPDYVIEVTGEQEGQAFVNFKNIKETRPIKEIEKQFKLKQIVYDNTQNNT